MRKLLCGATVLSSAAAVVAGSSAYFYRRTMMRSKAKRERTIKMSGTDWYQYYPVIEKYKSRMLDREHHDVWITSGDGLRLHGTYFPGSRGNRAVLCFHGYTSEGMSDFIGISDYYLNHGYQMLLVDERAHGKSEGEYIGFGYMDRKDALCWIRWFLMQVPEPERKQMQILLHGISMGGATVLMTTGLELPEQVKGVISDCAFTSPKEVFTHALQSMYHLPAFPMIQIADALNRRTAGYGLDDCNAAREVRKARIPALLIHGDADTFVPCSMCEEICRNYAAKKTQLLVPGAGHAESFYKDTETYMDALDAFAGGIIK